MQIREALTFDDVLLVPAQSSVLPSDVDTRTRVTNQITLNIPLLSSAMEQSLKWLLQWLKLEVLVLYTEI